MSLRLTKTRSDLRQPRFQSSRAFTLVELLVAMAIISILGALLVGVAAVATETARRARSEQMVSRLHTLLVDYYEGFQNRRVELSELRRGNSDPIGAGAAIDDALSPVKTTDLQQLRLNQRNRGRMLAAGRLYALRELMIMEMPDRWSDLMLTAVANLNDLRDNNVRPPVYASERSGLSRLMVRKLLALRGQTNAITGDPNTIEEILANQSAECLYLVITLATGDGEARGLFSESDIGDTDGDGALEFLDGWGQPIRFMRWAPGQNTSSQLNQLGLRVVWQDARSRADRQDSPNIDAVANEAYQEAAEENRDPFDLFGVQPSPLRDQNGQTLPVSFGSNGPQINSGSTPMPMFLLPIIYSLGPDGESGLADVSYAPAAVSYVRPNQLSVNDATLLFTRSARPNPFLFISEGLRGQDAQRIDIPQLGGTLDPELAADNISNHTTATN